MIPTRAGWKRGVGNVSSTVPDFRVNLIDIGEPGFFKLVRRSGHYLLRQTLDTRFLRLYNAVREACLQCSDFKEIHYLQPIDSAGSLVMSYPILLVANNATWIGGMLC